MTPPWSVAAGIRAGAVMRTQRPAGFATLRFELGDALLQRLEPRARAFQHLALRIEFVAARQIELAEIGAQHGPEVVFQVFAQPAGTGCEPGRQPLHQAAEQFFDPGYLHWRLS